MRYETAPMSLAIKVISAIVVAVDGWLFVASVFRPLTLVLALLVGLTTLGCYLRAPVAYYVSKTGLVVRLRLGQKRFGKIVKIYPAELRLLTTIRLFGNGGLFAGTGLFWNSAWGIFRAYVTTSDRSSLLLVETETGKVLISPDHHTELLDWFESNRPGKIHDSHGGSN